MPGVNSKLLIVVAETNAANYLLPLLSYWLENNLGPDCKVLAGPFAARRLAEGNAEIIFTEIENSVEDLDAKFTALVRSGWMPDALLVSAAGHPMEFAAMDKMLGKPRTQFIDTWTNYQRRFEGPGGRVVGEQIFVIDENARYEAVEAGLPGDLIVITGQPSWEGARPLNTPKNHDTLFLSAPVLEGYGKTLGYDEHTCWDLLVEVSKISPSLFGKIYFAPHPVEQAPTTERLNGASLIRYEPAILDQVSTVIGMFSSPMVDAFLGGRRVISLQPGAVGADQSPLSRHGFVPRVSNVKELLSAMDGKIKNGSAPLRKNLANSTQRLDKAIMNWLKA